jgi:hypothetical protein
LDIVVTQARTGELVDGMPVYAVTVKNTCDAPQCHIKLSCDGFNTTLKVDPAKFRGDGDGRLCRLNNGNTVVQGHDVNFSYVSGG